MSKKYRIVKNFHMPEDWRPNHWEPCMYPCATQCSFGTWMEGYDDICEIGENKCPFVGRDDWECSQGISSFIISKTFEFPDDFTPGNADICGNQCPFGRESCHWDEMNDKPGPHYSYCSFGSEWAFCPFKELDDWKCFEV